MLEPLAIYATGAFGVILPIWIVFKYFEVKNKHT